MGRDKSLGIEACPKCGNLGRRYRKKVRGRVGQQYFRRRYFLHNDRRLLDCYIDNLLFQTPYREMQDGLSQFGHVVGDTIRRLLKLPLTDEELKEVWSALEWSFYNILCPTEILKKVWCGKLNFSPEKRADLELLLFNNLKSKKNMFGPGGLESLSLYQKYIVPSNINRRKVINQKLRDSYNFPPRTLPSPEDDLSNPSLLPS